MGELFVLAVAFAYAVYKYVRRTIHHRQRLNFGSPDEVLQLSGPARHYELPIPQLERIPPDALTAQATKNFSDPEVSGASWFGGVVNQRRVVVRLQSEPLPQHDPLEEPLYWDAMWMWTALDTITELPRCVLRQDSMQSRDPVVRALSTSSIVGALSEGEMIAASAEGVALFSMSAYEAHSIGRMCDVLCEVANRLERAEENGRVGLRQMWIDAFKSETDPHAKAAFFAELWQHEAPDRGGPWWTDEREQFFVLLEVEAAKSAAPIQVAHASLTGDNAKLARFAVSADTDPALRLKALKALIIHGAAELESVTQSILQNERDGLLFTVALANLANGGPPYAAEWLQPPHAALREDAAESMLNIIRRAPEGNESIYAVLLALAKHRSDQISVDAIAVIGRRATTALIQELKKLKFDSARREHAVELAVAEFEGKRKDAVGGLSVMEPKSQGALSIDPGLGGSLSATDHES